MVQYSSQHGLVAQWMRALPCGGRGRAFESRRGRHRGGMSEWLKEPPSKCGRVSKPSRVRIPLPPPLELQVMPGVMFLIRTDAVAHTAELVGLPQDGIRCFLCVGISRASTSTHVISGRVEYAVFCVGRTPRIIQVSTALPRPSKL
jgi:hypothetical protein